MVQTEAPNAGPGARSGCGWGLGPATDRGPSGSPPPASCFPGALSTAGRPPCSRTRHGKRPNSPSPGRTPGGTLQISPLDRRDGRCCRHPDGSSHFGGPRPVPIPPAVSEPPILFACDPAPHPAAWGGGAPRFSVGLEPWSGTSSSRPASALRPYCELRAQERPVRIAHPRRGRRAVGYGRGGRLRDVPGPQAAGASRPAAPQPCPERRSRGRWHSGRTVAGGGSRPELRAAAARPSAVPAAAGARSPGRAQQPGHLRVSCGETGVGGGRTETPVARCHPCFVGKSLGSCPGAWRSAPHPPAPAQGPVSPSSLTEERRCAAPGGRPAAP